MTKIKKCNLNKKEYFDVFENKLQNMKTYTNVISYFVGKRLLPILCNLLNGTKIIDYQMIPTPELMGKENIFCLANDSVILDHETANRFDPNNNIWKYIVLLRKTGKDKKGRSKYIVLSRAELDFDKNDLLVSFKFKNAESIEYKNDINLFQTRLLNYLRETMCTFYNSGLIKLLNHYHTIEKMEISVLNHVDNDLAQNGLTDFSAFFATENPWNVCVSICLDYKKDCKKYSDIYPLFSYVGNIEELQVKRYQYVVSDILNPNSISIKKNPSESDQNAAVDNEISRKATKVFYNSLDSLLKEL